MYHEYTTRSGRTVSRHYNGARFGAERLELQIDLSNYRLVWEDAADQLEKMIGTYNFHTWASQLPREISTNDEKFKDAILARITLIQEQEGKPSPTTTTPG
jgi:hypothetical protein